MRPKKRPLPWGEEAGKGFLSYLINSEGDLGGHQLIAPSGVQKFHYGGFVYGLGRSDQGVEAPAGDEFGEYRPATR